MLEARGWSNGGGRGASLVDDKPVTAGTRVHDGAVVRVDGRQVTKEEEEIFLAFYKPKGIVCTTAQEENGEPIKNVVDYIDYPKRVYPVGDWIRLRKGYYFWPIKAM